MDHVKKNLRIKVYSISCIILFHAGAPQASISAPPLLDIYYTSDQPTNNYITTGDFSDHKAFLDFHSDTEIPSNVIQSHLHKTGTKSGILNERIEIHSCTLRPRNFPTIFSIICLCIMYTIYLCYVCLYVDQ